MLVVRQSTARTVTVGPVLDASGVAVTDCVVADFKLSKNGGAPSALDGSATLTHRHTGHYSLALTADDLDTVGQSEIVIDDTTNAMPVKEITVVEEAVYDAFFAASATGYVANAPVNVAQWLGTAPLALSSQQVQAVVPADTVVASVTGAVGSVTGNVGGNVTGSVGSVATGGITAASLADDCITAAKISTPAEASGNPTTILAMIRRVFEWHNNKRTRNRTTGVVTLRNAADDGDLVTYTQSTASVTDTEGASS